MADIMAEIKKRLEEDANADVQDLVKQRRAKIDADSNLAQYEQSQKDLEAQYLKATEPEVVQPTAFDMQRELLQSQAGTARDATLSALEQERQSRLPTFQQERNLISGRAAQQAKELDEMLAISGLTGSSTQANLAQKERGVEQSLLGQSQMAEGQFLGDIARRQTEAQQGYQTALQQGGLQLGIAEQQAQQQAQQQAFQNQLAEAQLTGQYGGGQTMQAQQQQFSQDLSLAKFNQDIQQNNLAQANWQQQFTYQQMQDSIANQMRAGQLSISQGNLALQQAKLLAEQDPNSLDNRYRQAQLESLQISNEQALGGGAEPYDYGNVKEYANALDAMGTVDEFTGQFVPNQMKQAQTISQWYENGVITKDEAWELANLYQVQDVDLSADNMPIPSWAKAYYDNK